MNMEPYYGCSGGCAHCPRMRQCQGTGTPAEVPAQEPGKMSLEQFLRENPDQGILRIQAFRGPQSIPVEGVKVTVSRQLDGGEHVFFAGTTDNSGLIDPIVLPAPARSQSLRPDDANPSATYTVRAEHPQFQPQEITVNLYQGIKTVQPLQLKAG